jgi:AcrR family transcriptional regulator
MSDPKERIIQAAAVLFAQQGYDGASTRAITQRAEVNSAMIAYYFGNKQALYEAVANRAVEEITKSLAPQTTSMSSINRLINSAQSLADIVAAKPQCAAILYPGQGGEVGRLHRNARERVAKAIEPMAAAVLADRPAAQADRPSVKLSAQDLADLVLGIILYNRSSARGADRQSLLIEHVLAMPDHSTPVEALAIVESKAKPPIDQDEKAPAPPPQPADFQVGETD